MAFPEWSRDPEYLPTLNDLEDLPKNWNWCKSDFIHHNPLWTPFQILNKEFIESLSKEILKITNRLSGQNITILEVWAWNWRLSYFLEKELTIGKVKSKIKQIATDDLSWFDCDYHEIWITKNKWIPLEDCNVENSVNKYKPNIVISSWMPDKEDWTSFFRKNKDIDAFILIWDPQECGTNESWEDCKYFKSEQLEIEWNICWRDSMIPWSSNRSSGIESYSQIFLFKRN